MTIAAGTGIAAQLWLRSLEPGLAAPGPVRRGVVLPQRAVPEDMSGSPANVQLDLSIDVVNALLHAWTGNGLLAEQVLPPRGGRRRWIVSCERGPCSRWRGCGWSGRRC